MDHDFRGSSVCAYFNCCDDVFHRRPVLFALLGEVDNEFRGRCGLELEEYPPKGLFCHLGCLAVASDFSKRGIGGNLSRIALENASAAGFVTSFAEATSYYSAAALSKCGMEPVHSIMYATWRQPKEESASTNHVSTGLHVDTTELGEMMRGEGVGSERMPPPLASVPLPHTGVSLMVIDHARNTTSK